MRTTGAGESYWHADGYAEASSDSIRKYFAGSLRTLISACLRVAGTMERHLNCFTSAYD